MRLYLFLFALGVGAILLLFLTKSGMIDWNPPEDPRHGIAEANAALLSWDGLVEKAAAGGLKGNAALRDPIPAEDLAAILVAVRDWIDLPPEKVSSIEWHEEVPGQVLVVLSSGWVWSEEAALACGSGQNFYLGKVDGVWEVVNTISWMS